MNPMLRLAPAMLVVATLVACGGEPGAAGDTGGSSRGDSSAAVVSTSDPTTAASTERPVEPADDPTTSVGAATSATVDLDRPPSPDPRASADDFPGFEWAFEQGYQEASYGRADYYEPSSVGEPGSSAGLAARKAYYAGFAKGLADYQAHQDEQQSQSSAAEQSAAADGIVGQTLPGYDPKQAALDLWDLESAEPCDAAPAADPCVDLRYNADNDVVVVARLEPTAGSNPDHAMLLTGQVRGYLVVEYWDAAEQPGSSLPSWAT